MVQPEYISLKNWAGSLLIDYSDYNIPLLYNEKKWELWAEDLLNTPPFRGRNIPLPQSIKEEDENEKWRQWARGVFYIMNQGQSKEL